MRSKIFFKTERGTALAARLATIFLRSKPDVLRRSTPIALIPWLLMSTVLRSEVRISEVNYEDRPQFQIVTDNATFFYDRAGGGFSRLIDRDGNDWIAFHKNPLKEFPASAAAGFRGLPNAVHGNANPDAGVGHPGFDRCQSRIIDGTKIRTRSNSGKWEWEWVFSDRYATLTILQADQAHPYWFLYEGPVGGKWSPPSHFFGTDQAGPLRDQPGQKTQILQPIRWAYFGDQSQSRVLLLLQRNEDQLVDNIWYLGASTEGLAASDGMVVFGFGRDRGSKPLLRGAGQQFRIAFIEDVSITRPSELQQKVSLHAQGWIDSQDWPAIEEQPSQAAIQVSNEMLFGDMDCFRITTPTATYLYGKRGAGFASILDPSGNDWISYHHGDQSKGEYRGLPKCGQPTKFFHCGYGFGQYATENPFTSTLEVAEPAHVRIRSVSQDDKSACTWDFFPTHATMTLERIGNPAYWFLYEGTPGGKLDPHDDFVVRPGNRQTSLNEPWTESVPWVYFIAKESPARLFLIDHQADAGPESYVSWPYKRDKKNHFQEMTVFGFGRPGWEDPKQHTPPLTQLPARFSIGMSTEASYDKIKEQIESILGGQE